MFLRYIGAYPLLEDNSVRSKASTVVDAQVGYQIARNTKLRLDLFNVCDAKTNDISDYYASHLPGERRHQRHARPPRQEAQLPRHAVVRVLNIRREVRRLHTTS